MSEAEEYAETTASLRAQLRPENILEEIFTAEIVTANRRLRRCRIDETHLSERELTPEARDKQQKSIDRARSLSQNIVYRSLAELRKLQTESAIRVELKFLGSKIENLRSLVDSRELLGAVRTFSKNCLEIGRANGLDPIEGLKARVEQIKRESVSSFCKEPEPVAA